MYFIAKALEQFYAAAAIADELIDTGLRKLSAIIGDRTEIGCNSVLSPGSILGKDCIVYPLTHWQGVLADAQIVKTRQPQDIVSRQMKD